MSVRFASCHDGILVLILLVHALILPFSLVLG